MKKVYQYEKYFETTDLEQPPSLGWLASFNISEAEAKLIENGSTISVENGKLLITDLGISYAVADVDAEPEG